MDYYNKYMKYKIKYNKLKQNGGLILANPFNNSEILKYDNEKQMFVKLPGNGSRGFTSRTLTALNSFVYVILSNLLYYGNKIDINVINNLEVIDAGTFGLTIKSNDIDLLMKVIKIEDEIKAISFKNEIDILNKIDKIDNIHLNKAYFAIRGDTEILPDTNGIFNYLNFKNNPYSMGINFKENVMKQAKELDIYYEEDILSNSIGIIFIEKAENNIKNMLEKIIKIKDNYNQGIEILKLFFMVYKGVYNGIKELHKNNIIHCDIKLNNLVYKNGICQIIDFGGIIEIKDIIEIKTIKDFMPNEINPPKFIPIGTTIYNNDWNNSHVSILKDYYCLYTSLYSILTSFKYKENIINIYKLLLKQYSIKQLIDKKLETFDTFIKINNNDTNINIDYTLSKIINIIKLKPVDVSGRDVLSTWLDIFKDYPINNKYINYIINTAFSIIEKLYIYSNKYNTSYIYPNILFENLPEDITNIEKLLGYLSNYNNLSLNTKIILKEEMPINELLDKIDKNEILVERLSKKRRTPDTQ